MEDVKAFSRGKKETLEKKKKELNQSSYPVTSSNLSRANLGRHRNLKMCYRITNIV
jgi:hypothetical protein